MAKSKSQEKREEIMGHASPSEQPQPSQKMVFGYRCPACTNVAIETTNKMLGVDIDCKSCGKRIKLDDEKNYIKL